MLAVVMVAPPMALTVFLAVLSVACLLLAAHEAGYLGWLRDRRVVGLALAVLLALLATQTMHASYYYDTSFYCEWMGWIDWWTC